MLVAERYSASKTPVGFFFTWDPSSAFCLFVWMHLLAATLNTISQLACVWRECPGHWFMPILYNLPLSLWHMIYTQHRIGSCLSFISTPSWILVDYVAVRGPFGAVCIHCDLRGDKTPCLSCSPSFLFRDWEKERKKKSFFFFFRFVFLLFLSPIVYFSAAPKASQFGSRF